MRKQYAVFHYDSSATFLVQAKRRATPVEEKAAIMRGEDDPQEAFVIFDTKDEAEEYIRKTLGLHYPQFIIESYRP